jgi:outer membrane protein TolC
MSTRKYSKPANRWLVGKWSNDLKNHLSFCRGVASLLTGLALLGTTTASAAPVPTPEVVLQLISASPLLALDAASGDIARSRLDRALSALKPRLTGKLDGKRYSSMRSAESRDSDVLGSLEVVQPIYDFGRSYRGVDAARAEIQAQASAQKGHLNTLVLEGMALYYELHASDLEVQALEEENTIAFFIAARLEEKDAVGDANPIDLLEARARRDRVRYIYFKGKSTNLEIRLRLEELTGQPFKETTLTPDVPEDDAIQVDTEKLIALALESYPVLQSLMAKRDAMQARVQAASFSPQIEAYGRVSESTRNLRGRDEWAVGARLVVPLYDGGKGASEKAELAAKRRQLDARIADLKRSLVRKTHVAWLARSDARRRLTAARLAYKAGRQRLLLEQLQRSQDREASVGGASARIGHIETELVRAIGAWRVAGLQLAALLGRPLNESFAPNFLEDLKIADQ